MARKRSITGERPPSYVSRPTLAAELDISEATVDDYVRRDLLPKPIRCGGSVRWCWAEVVVYMNRLSAGADDKFMAGVQNV